MSGPVAVYDFTASAETNTKEAILTWLNDWTKKWCFQKESGETGFIHFQGRFSLKAKKRLDLLVKVKKNDWHMSITSTENSTNEFYVCKADTRLDGPWKNTDEPDRYIPRQIREIGHLRPWQQAIVDDAKVWNTRTINIILDMRGNIGKSILKTWIGVYGIGRSLPFMTNYKDVMRMVMDTKKSPLYIIDIPRALAVRDASEFFSGVETIKDGYAFDDRYHFKEEYFDSPNIWMFLNTKPNLDFLSIDRWRLWEVVDNNLVPYLEKEETIEEPVGLGVAL